jgi:hypothetical protein
MHLALLALLLAAPRETSRPSWHVAEGTRFRTTAIEANPLGIAIGRYSLNVEFLPDRHHAAHLSGHVYFSVPGNQDELNGYGAELGYRYYTGRDGPEGLFLGGAFLIGQYQYDAEGLRIYQAYQSFGGAIDVGWQFLVGGNFVIGPGVGAQYTHYSTDPVFAPGGFEKELFFGAGLRPRLLLSFGGAF